MCYRVDLKYCMAANNALYFFRILIKTIEGLLMRPPNRRFDNYKVKEEHIVPAVIS